MSFSSATKEEIANLRIKKPCCRLAAFAALVQLAGSLQLGAGGKRSVVLTTESYAVARWAVKLSKALYSLESVILVKEHKRLGKNRSFSISLSGEQEVMEEMLLDVGMLCQTEEGLNFGSGLNEALLKEDCCKRAYLRGAFMGGGSLSNPERGYHLEFVVRTSSLAGDLCRLLNEYDLRSKTVERNGAAVVYIKESERITDFLALIGAHGALLELETVKTNKEFKNGLNRRFNCETANIKKTVDASLRQKDNIRYLINHDAFSSLSPELRSAAEARIEYPEATLAELGALLDPPVGKSGVNHRLRKLERIALSLKDKKGE